MNITRRNLLTMGAGLTGAIALGACTPQQSSANPIMKWADDSAGKPYSKDPSVIYFNGKYFMYFSMPPLEGESRWRQGVTQSTDMLNWTDTAEITPVGSLEAQGICAGGAIVLNGLVHLFYQTYGNAVDVICHAVSDNGVDFERDPFNPIIKPTGSWNCGRAIDADPVVVGDELFCYWATRDPGKTIQMLGVHSTPMSGVYDSFFGRRWYQRNGGSILKPHLSWEKTCLEAPNVIKKGSNYFLFYGGAYNNAPQQIGVAKSINGRNFTRLSSQPFLSSGKPGTWNSSETGHPGIFFDPKSGKTYLFFQGNNDGGKTYYLSRREVLWDRNGNPVLGS